MTDPTLAKADLYDQIKDIDHPKCTLEVVSAIFDTRMEKRQETAGEAHAALTEQHQALRARFRRSV